MMFSFLRYYINFRESVCISFILALLRIHTRDHIKLTVSPALFQNKSPDRGREGARGKSNELEPERDETVITF